MSNGFFQNEQSVVETALGDVAEHNTTSHACSSAKNVARIVCVYHWVFTVTTGRPRKVVQNGHRVYHQYLLITKIILMFISIYSCFHFDIECCTVIVLKFI